MIIITALMTIVVMVRFTLVLILMMGLLFMSPVIILLGWRRRLPAVTTPIQAMIIALTNMMPLMFMPPLRWSPVIAIPVVSALILISDMN